MKSKPNSTDIARRAPYKAAENDRIAARSAELSVQGVKLSDQSEIINKEFGIVLGPYRLDNIRRKPIFREIQKKFRTELVEESVARLKQDVSRLRPKIMKAIEAGLDAENMQAVRLALEVVGFGEKLPNKEPTEDKQLVVILPGTDLSSSSVKEQLKTHRPSDPRADDSSDKEIQRPEYTVADDLDVPVETTNEESYTPVFQDDDHWDEH